MMKNTFDRMLLDCTIRCKKAYPNDWKFNSAFILTFLGAFNLYTIGFWLKYYFEILPIPTLKVNLFPPDVYLISMLNYVPGFCLLYGLSAFIITYFLIFHKGRYLKLMRRYPEVKGDKHYQIIYILSTIVFCVGSIFIVYAIKGPLH